MNDEILGEYVPFGCVVDESISAEVFNDALNYFFHAEDLQNRRIFRTTKTPEARETISNDLLLKYVHSLLAWQHERSHFYQIPSSPLGVFLFRSTIAKHAMIQRLLVDMQKTEWIRSGKSIYVPIPTWHRWLSKNLPNDEITRKVDDIVMAWNSHNTFESTMFRDRITDVSDAIDDVTRLQYFTSKMLNRYFDVPSGLPMPRITTRLDKNSASVPTQYCTTLRILESYARCIELKFLSSLEVPKTIRNILIEELSTPKYTGVISYIDWLYPGVDTDTMMGLMDLSLFSPVDSLFHSFWTGELVWEDIHPGFRLMRIASMAKEKFLKVQQKKYLDFYDALCHELHWTLASDMLEKMHAFTVVDRSFSEVIELLDGIPMKDKVRRSSAEKYMFELVKVLSRLRTEHQEFVGFPYGVVMNSETKIEPFLNFIGDGITLGSTLGIDKIELLGSSLRYNILLDSFRHEDFRLTEQTTRRFLKGFSQTENVEEFVRMLVEGYFFLPYERVKPVSQIQT